MDHLIDKIICCWRKVDPQAETGRISLQSKLCAYILGKLTVDKPMPNNELIERFKTFYQHMLATEWAELDNIYSANISFCDPIHHVEGREALYRYFDDLCQQVLNCRFDFLDQVVSPGKAYLKWDMHFSHPKFGSNKTITVRGVSQLQYNDAGIYYHEDVYDMGALIYENIPLFGGGVRWLKHRLSKAAS